MQIDAVMVDTDTPTVVKFSLTMSQQGRPLYVWGRGVLDHPEKQGGLTTNNYYYSLTRVHTEGTLTLGDAEFAVQGLTWMDHEYGYFGSAKDPALWFLQTMQLDNGIHISHYTTFSGAPPSLDKPVQSNATIEFPDGTTYYQTDCVMTPTGRTWTGPTGVLFYMEFKVEIPAFDAVIHVESLMDAQDFPFPPLPGDTSKGRDTYEGVAKASGTFNGERVQGTAWNEQQS
ncbi:hypothetical protein LRS56_17810 [Pseudomonas poae]|nr:hypothetical protein LRS56_17810 [Pseudomonas poae]